MTRSWKGKEASHSSDTSNRTFSLFYFSFSLEDLLFYLSAHYYFPYTLLVSLVIHLIQFCSVFSSDDGEYIDGDEAVTYEGEEGGNNNVQINKIKDLQVKMKNKITKMIDLKCQKNVKLPYPSMIVSLSTLAVRTYIAL